MCIAILQKPGFKVPEGNLFKCYTHNRDGGGLAFVNKNGEVQIEKGYFTFKDFYDQYNRHHDANPDSHFLLHFRIATKGKVLKDNCHPFKIKGGALIHNGSFYGGSRDDEKSDTREVCEDMFNNFSKARLRNGREALERVIGQYNKIVTLYKDNSFIIVNEQAGQWEYENKVWFSNTWAYKDYSRSNYNPLTPHYGD